MSESPFPDEWSFDQALTVLLRHAFENGWDPEGAWKCSLDGDDGPHWDVQITKVEYAADD